ncbi:EF-P 5-aminopentanol modification-associated protein YfmF [Enterococcus canintestini]|uniref:M16 family metallopeptidase n=1 Tax=Enterococcus canintestini TaxID=317010 RepID=A0A267HT73_9ENTE|nr:pitrilysin family protein [Enterococcus canintestini]PAB01569.1 M16 family metallopeptidase [Enterococcus canintestini]
MSVELGKGINLEVIPTKKYKTTRILIRFSARHSEKTAAARTLLTSLLETNSLNYPTQNELSTRLAELYGASFGVSVAKKGNLHQVNVGMSLVNGSYVGNENLLNEAVAFLQEILFAPNVKDGAFDEKTFATEKENLLAYLKSMKEDKQTYASLRLQELFFQNDADQKVPSFGTVATAKGLTATDLVAVHQKMLNEDHIDIFVIGDVEPKNVQEIFAQMPFLNSERVKPEIFFTQSHSNIINEHVEYDQVIQAKLNLAYQIDTYYGDPSRFALMVFNGLFGGFPHSKLFMNVREKESLAYYASSSFDSFRGLLKVQTGIDQEKREAVLHLINEQLESLRQGEVTQEELAQTKAMLKNQYLLSLDNPQALMENAYLDLWLPHTKMSEEAFIAGIDEVSIEAVKKIALSVKLKAIYCLERSES